MYYSFDAFEYIKHLRAGWRVALMACGVAAGLAIGISLMLPRQYTATASIIIEPPGGSDARLTTAVSAMYLESLKTYELFATGDTLFAKAADLFHLRRDSSQSLEGLKRSILKVVKLRDTKVLEISATLRDPRQAQALAEYLAAETVNMSRAENLAADRDFIRAGEQQTLEAKKRLDELERTWNATAVSEPVEALQSEIDTDIALRGKVEERLLAAQADIAEYQAQAAQGSFAREQFNAAQAQAALLSTRSRELQQVIQQKAQTLSARNGRRQSLQAALDTAQQSYETVSRRFMEAQSAAGTHAERLRIIDPGIVPQRPSSPNISLNVAVALLAALIGSLVYLSCTFVYRRKQVTFEPFEREMRV